MIRTQTGVRAEFEFLWARDYAVAVTPCSWVMVSRVAGIAGEAVAATPGL